MKSKLYYKYYEYYINYFNTIGLYYLEDNELWRLIMNDLGGCITGDETMEYYTPDRKYRFIIYRTEIYSENYYNDYRITIEIYDGIIGNNILKMCFDINSCVNILYNLCITPDILMESQDNNIVYINPDNSDLSGYMISITSIFGLSKSGEIGKNSPMYNIIDNMSNRYEKDVRLDIYCRSYIYDNITPLVSIDLTFEELSDLCFHVFFVSIIDLDFPEEYRDILEQIESFVSNYQIYSLQNKNI